MNTNPTPSELQKAIEQYGPSISESKRVGHTDIIIPTWVVWEYLSAAKRLQQIEAENTVLQEVQLRLSRRFHELEQKLQQVEKERDELEQRIIKVSIEGLDERRFQSVAEMRVASLFNSKKQLHSLTKQLVEALKDLLNHGASIPDPRTGEYIPYESNPELAKEALNEYEKLLGQSK